MPMSTGEVASLSSFHATRQGFQSLPLRQIAMRFADKMFPSSGWNRCYARLLVTVHHHQRSPVCSTAQMPHAPTHHRQALTPEIGNHPN